MLAGACTDQLFVEALRSLTHQDIGIEPPHSIEMPVREVDL
jgi:hypothetical protein